MATRNYKSDFNFVLHLYSVLKDKEGKEKERKELPWPDYDWTAKFWTSNKANAYTASCIGGVCTNCRERDGRILIVVDNHNMGMGRLKMEFRAELPREIYPDGSERNVVPGELDIELVRGAGDFPSDFDAELMMPFIKGDPGAAFTFSDFTEEQIAELQRPATEAAQRADEAEKIREANEEQRIKSEMARSTAYKEIARAEDERVGAEAGRVKAEQGRVSAETVRVQAEKIRAAEETARANAEKNRVTAESDRAAQERSRVTAETARATAEQTRTEAEERRENAENNRNDAEDDREAQETVRQSKESARQTSEQTRETHEQTRQTNETSRESNETERQTAEQNRATAENEREEAETERRQAEQTRAEEFAGFEDDIKAASFKVFDDMFRAAVGTAGTIDRTHYDEPDADGNRRHTPYYLNTLWMTYEEAVKVMEAKPPRTPDLTCFLMDDAGVRTNLPLKNMPGGGGGVNSAHVTVSMAFNAPDLEVVNLGGENVRFRFKGYSSFINAFNAAKLHTIIGRIDFFNSGVYPNGSDLNHIMFGPALINVKINNLNTDLKLVSPVISLESLRYMIQNSAAPDAGITLTVHSDVYAKITDTANTGWYALLDLAAQKNINIATTA